MKVGLSGHFLRHANRAALLEWFRRVDAGPFHSLSTGERLLFDNLDQITYLAAAAAVTERVMLMTNVTVVPIHPTVLLAKRMASIDLLSAGRLIIGAGTGSQESDYRSAERSMERRWQRLDEAVATVKELWCGALPYPDAPAPVGPTPSRPGGPLLYTGARAPRSLARAARWADGWQGTVLRADPADLRAEADAHVRAWADAGRDTRPKLLNSVMLTVDAEADSSPGAARPTFGVSDIPMLLERHQEAGYDELVLAPMLDDPGLLDGIEKSVAAAAR
ncbi:LLM class flavin-dependent oxidoreductase [Pseudonocardia sp. GCM10023141]|uniref:LLM class flavin-dependent oxidoreductase n=1 Tax=Pseudonocardia sp. GCM10023141 TaxID=3252653 RepID=UPI0036182FA5